MRLCSYVVKNDKGLAPNPFWGYCTLALCTPNHMGIKAEKGDWLVGNSSVAKGNKLIFAMQVEEILSFDQYYNDPRFKRKKPDKNGTWRRQCGDNMYFKNKRGKWKQHPSQFHNTPKDRKKDLKNPFVYISKRFYYFGDHAVSLPGRYGELILKRQGCKCSYDTEIVNGFLKWLQKKYEPGIYGKPQDILGECCFGAKS
jgi:hypothetical protein